MNAYVDVGGSEVLTLKGALLVYQGRSRGFVAWHEVRRNTTGGAPFLGEAQEVLPTLSTISPKVWGPRFRWRSFQKTFLRVRLKQ